MVQEASRTIPDIENQADTKEIIPIVPELVEVYREQQQVDQDLLQENIFEALGLPKEKQLVMAAYVDSGAWLKQAKSVELHSGNRLKSGVSSKANLEVKIDIWELIESSNQVTLAELGLSAEELAAIGIESTNSSQRLADAMAHRTPDEQTQPEDVFITPEEIDHLKQIYQSKAGVTGTEISVSFALGRQLATTAQAISGPDTAVNLLRLLTSDGQDKNSLQWRYKHAQHIISLFHGWNADTWIARYQDDDYGQIDIPGILLKNLPSESCVVTFPRLGTRQEYPLTKQQYTSKDDAAMVFLTMRMMGAIRSNQPDQTDQMRTVEIVGHSMGGAMALYLGQIWERFNSTDRGVFLALNPAFQQRVVAVNRGSEIGLKQITDNPNTWTKVGAEGFAKLIPLLTQVAPLPEAYRAVGIIPQLGEGWSKMTQTVTKMALPLSFGRFHKHFLENHAAAFSSSWVSEAAARTLAKSAADQPGIDQATWEGFTNKHNLIVATSAADTLINYSALKNNLPHEDHTLPTDQYIPTVVLPSGDHYALFYPQQLFFLETMLQTVRLELNDFSWFKTEQSKLTLAYMRELARAGKDSPVDFDLLTADYLEQLGDTPEKLDSLAKRFKIESTTLKKYLQTRQMILRQALRPDLEDRLNSLLSPAMYGSSPLEFADAFIQSQGQAASEIRDQNKQGLSNLEAILRGLHMLSPFIDH